MKKIGIVSCNKWVGKLEEDINLKKYLNELGVDARIISWQQPLDDNYDLLIIRSIWGYQDYFEEFKRWLNNINNKGLKVYNDPDLVLNNVLKDRQFNILTKNGIDVIETQIFSQNDLGMLGERIYKKPYVVKPTISGSGDNTYCVDEDDELDIPNKIKVSDVIRIYRPILEKSKDCGIIVQPFIKEIDQGEYSCIFIDGELTHTMMRYPNIFHDKKRPHIIDEVPEEVLRLAKKVEQIPEYKNYLYMRVDMVLIDGVAKIMEVELAEPDLLTKYISDQEKKDIVIRKFAKSIERRC